MLGESNMNIKGIYILALDDIFKNIMLKSLRVQISVSFYEIYCDKAYDLLNDRENCPIRVDD